MPFSAPPPLVQFILHLLIFFSCPRASSPFLFPTCNVLFLSLTFIFQLSQMDVPLTITFSSSLVSIIPSASLTHCCVRLEEEYSFVKPAQVKGGGGNNWRGGGGGVGGGLPGQIHFQSSIFSFVFFLLFRRKKKREEKQKKEKHAHAHTHILRNGPDGHRS